MARQSEPSRSLHRHTFTSKPEEDEKEGRGPLCPRPREARARLRASDYKQDDSCHEPIGRSRERVPRGSSVQLGEPIEVKVVLMGELKRWAGKQDVDVELQPGDTVQTLVAKLPELCGETFAHRALSKQGRLQPHIAVFINGVQMGKLDGTRTVLTGGRVELMLLPVYEGG